MFMQTEPGKKGLKIDIQGIHTQLLFQQHRHTRRTTKPPPTKAAFPCSHPPATTDTGCALHHSHLPHQPHLISTSPPSAHRPYTTPILSLCLFSQRTNRAERRNVFTERRSFLAFGHVNRGKA